MSDLSELRERLRTQRPVPWEHLPDFPLYMDQVLSYMERQSIRFDGEDSLTAAMVNNYTKSGLVPRAEGKKYDREHLAYLTAICILKHVMSTKDLGLLLREELGVRSVQEGYGAFCESLDRALNITADAMDDQVVGNGALADAAIRFALLSYAAGVASRRYVALLRDRMEEERPAGERGKKERG